MIGAVLACDANGGIGKNGSLPWPKVSEDLKRFREITTGNVVVMGRRTWDDPLLPKPLIRRTNVIVTSKPLEIDGLPIGDCDVITANGDIGLILTSLQDKYPYHRILVIGGANLFEQSLPYIQEIFLTKINLKFDCDQFINYNRIRAEFTKVVEIPPSMDPHVEYFHLKR